MNDGITFKSIEQADGGPSPDWTVAGYDSREPRGRWLKQSDYYATLERERRRPWVLAFVLCLVLMACAGLIYLGSAGGLR